MDFSQAGEAIAYKRKERGLTQEQLASILDVAPNTISRIERGIHIPSVPCLIDICNALDTSTDYILAAYMKATTPIRWTNLAEQMAQLPLETQEKVYLAVKYIVDIF